MESSILKKASKFLQEHKNNHRWQAVFLTLALVVSLGTVGVLTLTGHAQTYKVKRLVCDVADHTHTAECYGEDGKLTCKKPEMILHTHNDVDCYNDDGVLICDLEEREPHTHTADCYTEEQELTCGLEEFDGHTHTDECYEEQGGGELICGKVEHEHGEGCYDEEGNQICTQEVHTHTDDCYSKPERVLVCGQEESGHHHDSSCYTTHRRLTCTNEYVEHTHSASCYEAHTREIDNGDGTTTTETYYTLECGKPSTAVHTHTSDCIVIEEMTDEELAHKDPIADGDGKKTEPEEITDGGETEEKTENIEDGITGTPAEKNIEEEVTGTPEPEGEEAAVSEEAEPTCGKEEHQHTDECRDESGELICGKEEHTHDETCYPAEEPAAEEEERVLICGQEEHIHDASCLDENGDVGCGKTTHQHTDECYMTVEPEEKGKVNILVCGQEEHTHTSECMSMAGGCGHMAHTHTKDCYMSASTQTVKDEQDGATITAYYGDDAGLEGAVLKAEPMEVSEEDRDAVRAMPGMESKDVSSMVMYDIGFYRTAEDGAEEEVEPTKGSKVIINVKFDGKEGFSSDDSVTVVHFVNGEDPEKLEPTTVNGEEGITFETSSFSAFVMAPQSGTTRGGQLYIVGGLLLAAAMASLIYIKYIFVERRRRSIRSSGKR